MESKIELGVIAQSIVNENTRLLAFNALNRTDFEDDTARKLYKTMRKIIINKGSLSFTDLTLKSGIDIDLKPYCNLEDVDYSKWIKEIKENGVQFKTTNAAQEFFTEVKSNPESFDKSLDKLKKEIATISANSVEIPDVDEITQSFLDRSSGQALKPFGSTGIWQLDSMLKGFVPGWVYSICAGSGVGKSMLGLQIFDECMVKGEPCLYLSSEMDNDEIYARLVSRRTTVPYFSILTNDIDTSVKTRNAALINQQMRDSKSGLVDRVFNLSTIEKIITNGVVKLGTKLVVIDHIHNLRDKGEIYERIANASHSLQEMAQKYNIAIVILAQIAKGDQKENDIEKVSSKGAMDLEEVSNMFAILDRSRLQKSEASKSKGGSVLASFDEEDEDPSIMKIFIKKFRAGQGGKVVARVDFNSMIIK